ncbi:MAG: hypothetical protein Q9163_000698 [Psora crenata]
MEGLAQEWLRLDRDESTRSEIQWLLNEQNLPALEERLSTRLTFGTAGLRSRMGAGFSRLNKLTIIQTSQGLAEYLLAEQNGATEAGILLGHDARHNSKCFAEYAAAAFIAKGIKVWWYEDLVHTPMVPFGVRSLRAAAGVMITASHNPAQDNGYKVYGPTGCQINTPVDEKIAAFILKNLEPETWDVQNAMLSSLKEPVLTRMTSRYMTSLQEFVVNEPLATTRSFPPFVYTPMHGVGLEYLTRAIESLTCSLGVSNYGPLPIVIVDEQAHPDPDFPTVRYPNPEEDGALDLAKSTADQHCITLIVANDPDADRLAIAEKVDGKWNQFTGDQVGVLLAHYLISCGAGVEPRKTAKAPKRKQYMLASAVSSQMLSRIAAGAQISFEETLTGFKWLGRRAMELQQQGCKCLLAYEEALGYMFPDVVYDKDGILAAAVFLAACSRWLSPWAELQQLYARYGYFETMNTYWRSPDLATTVHSFEHIRHLHPSHPQSVAGRKVLRWRDLTRGYDSNSEDHKPDLPCSSSSQMITCWLSGQEDEGIRFTVRASGTEPKIKNMLRQIPSYVHKSTFQKNAFLTQASKTSE